MSKPLRMTIKQIRKRIGVDSKIFADMLGCWYQTIRNWETYKSKPQDKYRADIFQSLLDAVLDDGFPISDTDIELLMSCTRDQQDSAMIRVLLTKLNEWGE